MEGWVWRESDAEWRRSVGGALYVVTPDDDGGAAFRAESGGSPLWAGHVRPLAGQDEGAVNAAAVLATGGVSAPPGFAVAWSRKTPDLRATGARP